MYRKVQYVLFNIFQVRQSWLQIPIPIIKRNKNICFTLSINPPMFKSQPDFMQISIDFHG
ncbi:hypothetical protein EZS27_000833 [termite gut metagenome]|uniref:Uncharacterized protein n=1 Tax=termite gut metagenome TaxID=433724 RepID=A0A5J4T0R1_9ZZZZ